MPPKGIRYYIGDVKPGMTLAAELVSAKDVVMLSVGTVLSKQSIELIKRCGFNEVYISPETSYGTDNEKKISNQDYFVEQYSCIAKKVKSAFENIRYAKNIPLSELRGLAEQVTDSLSCTRGVVDYLNLMRTADNYTFQHSLNVSILSGLFGRWLGFSGIELQNIVFGGLLHDIGKTKIPLRILNKPGKLSEYEMTIMKRHAVLGLEILEKADLTNFEVIAGVWQHHERLDGTGYPLGLEAAEIHRNAKIIAIADIYDAMTANRVYRRGLSPFEVMETLCNEMFNKLDPAFCAIILNYLKDFFIGNVVVLNDGRQAEIICVDKDRDIRPVVRTRDGEYINLEKNRDIIIVEVLN